MPKYAIVNSETGEMDMDCPICAFMSISGNFDDDEVAIFESQEIPEGHIMIEITNEERDKLRELKYIVDRDGKEEIVSSMGDLTLEERESAKVQNAHKIDLSKAEKKINDREIEEISTFINGIGGQEILFTEERPASVVIERQSREVKGDK